MTDTEERKMHSTNDVKVEISTRPAYKEDDTNHPQTEQSEIKSDTVECRCDGCAQRVDPRSPLHNDTTVGYANKVCRLFHIPQKINWAFLMKYARKWVKHPMNMAVLVWVAFIIVGMVFLVLLTADLVTTNRGRKKQWTEIDNQILNAFYTIMCLYQHPSIFHHTVLLVRWSLYDILKLRKAYCKSLAQRSYERAHIAFIVTLLHITCFSQYVLCDLYWGYSDVTRPALPDTLSNVVSTVAPIIAGLYVLLSPLGRKPKNGIEPESEITPETEDTCETKPDRVNVVSPKWAGGLYGCDDINVACMSIFCTCCVFAWNMGRLGLGNKYLHVITFVMFMMAPVVVFYVTALNIDDGLIRVIVVIFGLALSFLGLLYGGYWRVKMRKKFQLPGDEYCCANASVTDFAKCLSLSIDVEKSGTREEHIMTPPIVLHLVSTDTTEELKIKHGLRNVC